MFTRFISALGVIGVILVVLIGFQSPAFAADIITSPYGLSNINGVNLQGDILYLPSTGDFAVGAGTTIATIVDTVELRGEFVEPIDGNSGARTGLGIGINIPKLIGKLKGDWLLDNINTSVGVTGLLNLDGGAHIEPAVYLTVIKMGF